MTNSTVINRRKRESNDLPLTSAKRIKCRDDDSSLSNAEHVEASELASAFALASLASFSPKQNTIDTTAESRDVESGTDHFPVSPEIRSPIRRSKRVTFSNDTKEPQSDLRSVSFSPRSSRSQAHRQNTRLSALDVSTPLASNTAPFWTIPQRFSTPLSAFHPHIPSPVQEHGQWICDFCNTAAFFTYEEACAHEESCRMKYSHLSRQQPPSHTWRRGAFHNSSRSDDASMSSRVSADGEASLRVSSISGQWFPGSLSLELPDSDKDWLSKTNCYIRKSCVEAFAANDDEVRQPSLHGSIIVGQVGIRCCFCRDRPCDQKVVEAISFPSSVAGIYESVKRWQKFHLEVCHSIPTTVKERINQLGNDSAWVPTARQYWVESARALGMVDSQYGIRFSIDPKQVSRLALQGIDSCIESNTSESRIIMNERQDITGNQLSCKSSSLCEGESIVYPEDMAMIPPYVYFLMRQVESTFFTEADRFVARSKGPVGFPGFQCRHCRGHAGLGKYFPVTTKSLSTNSTSQNIHSHMLKCRKVSPYVKDQLLALKDEKSKSPRLEPGWRRIFFEKIWSRLHGSSRG